MRSEKDAGISITVNSAREDLKELSARARADILEEESSFYQHQLSEQETSIFDKDATPRKAESNQCESSRLRSNQNQQSKRDKSFSIRKGARSNLRVNEDISRRPYFESSMPSAKNGLNRTHQDFNK